MYRFLIIQGDLSDASVRQKIIQQTVDKFGRLDILVPNAGIILEDSSIARATEDAFDQIMNVNVKAVFFLIKEAIPHLEKTKGCIVNVSSTGSTLVYPDEIIYSMSKAAVDHMTRTFALGLAPKGKQPSVAITALISKRI